MNAPREVPQAVIDALLRGDKMTAIKLVRELTGDDLKSAMQMVQQIATQLQTAKRTGSHSGAHHQPETRGQLESRERSKEFMAGRHTPTVMPGDQGGRGLSWVIFLGLAALAWWTLFGR